MYFKNLKPTFTPGGRSCIAIPASRQHRNLPNLILHFVASRKWHSIRSLINESSYQIHSRRVQKYTQCLLNIFLPKSYSAELNHWMHPNSPSDRNEMDDKFLIILQLFPHLPYSFLGMGTLDDWQELKAERIRIDHGTRKWFIVFAVMDGPMVGITRFILYVLINRNLENISRSG